MFGRTPRGDELVRETPTALPLQVTRLLMLFEEPQSVSDLRQMIDEPWLPAALIDLERRRLIVRLNRTDRPAPAAVSMPAPPQSTDARPLAPPRSPATSALEPLARSAAGSPFELRLALVRLGFQQLLGALGDDMGRRIGQCGNPEELERLMPQVEALVEAIAGRDALTRFRQRIARDH